MIKTEEWELPAEALNYSAIVHEPPKPPSFREWLEPRRHQYCTAYPGMIATQYIQNTLNDLSNAFIDYADEVLAKRSKDRE